MVDIFQLLKAIVRWKCVGKLLDSSPMYLEVLKLLRQYFGGIICPPGWGKVNWVGEKQYCCCRNPVAVLRFSGSVTAQLRRGQHLLTYYYCWPHCVPQESVTRGLRWLLQHSSKFFSKAVARVFFRSMLHDFCLLKHSLMISGPNYRRLNTMQYFKLLDF